MVTAGVYTPIKEGQVATLQLNTAVDPPVYSWSPQEGPHEGFVQAINRTDRPAAIGLGFITDLGTDHEQMEIVTGVTSVNHGATQNMVFAPVLHAYAGPAGATVDALHWQTIRDAADTDVREKMQHIWSANLSNLVSDVSVMVRRNAFGNFEASPIVMSMGDQG